MEFLAPSGLRGRCGRGCRTVICDACAIVDAVTITVSLPAEIEQKMQPSEAKLHLAIGAFAAEEVTLGQGAEIAGGSQTEFMRELSRRRIPLHYDREAFAEDLQAIAKLNAQLDHGGHQ